MGIRRHPKICNGCARIQKPTWFKLLLTLISPPAQDPRAGQQPLQATLVCSAAAPSAAALAEVDAPLSQGSADSL